MFRKVPASVIPGRGSCAQTDEVFSFTSFFAGMKRKAGHRPSCFRFFWLPLPPYSLACLVCFFLCLSPGGSLTGQENRTARLPAADSTLRLEEITVEAYRVAGRTNSLPGNLARLSGEALSHGSGLQFSELINILPGVTMQSGTLATGRIVIRGMGSRPPYNTNRIRAYLDGIPLTGADGVSSPEEIDFASLDRMEVIRGPSSALYGSGLGGSIALYTPVYAADTGQVSLQYGSFGTAHLRLGGNLHKEKGSLWSSLSHLHSNGFRENDLYRRSSLITSGRYRGKGFLVSGTLLLSDIFGAIPSSLGKTLFTEHPASAAPNWKAVAGYQLSARFLGGVTLAASLSDNTTGRLTLYGRISDDYEKRPFNNLDDRSGSVGLRGRITRHARKSVWIAGGEWSSERYAWTLDKEGNLLNQNRENRRQWQLFTMWYHHPSPRITLSLAAAMSHTAYSLDDLFPANGDQSGNRKFPLIFSPRAGVSGELSKVVSVFVSAGHGYSLPSPEETLLPEGDVNPAIRHEQGFQFELGARIAGKRQNPVTEVTFYRIDLRDLLVTKRLTEELFTGINAGRTRHHGIELSATHSIIDKPLFPGTLTSRLGYAASLHTFVDFTDDGQLFDGNHLPGIPASTLHCQLVWKPFPWLETQASLSWTGGQYLNDANSLQQPGYLLAHLKAETLIPAGKHLHLRLHLGAANLTNTRYASMIVVNALAAGNAEPRYYYPGMPRNAYAGITLLF